MTERASAHLRLSSYFWGVGVGRGAISRVGESDGRNGTIRPQSSVEVPQKTELPQLILSNVGGICQRGTNFSTGEVLFFPFQPEDALANT